MNRSMYSGVAGMKTHQSRMDVIGNNIANVNTYGFKAGRAVFRDVYYQTLKSATGGTATSGGTNPSQVGYGSQLGSVDVMMGGSSFQMTDNTMDMAIDGDGFLQVQDADGNRFFTRSGQLSFDPASGSLVDSQGNFVLGVNGNPIGQQPGNEMIQVALPPVSPTAAKSSDIINSVGFKITAENATKDGNVAMQFVPGEKMTDGVKAVAEVGTAGIIIRLNPKEKFANLQELNDAANKAIEDYMQTNNGKSHPAGKFTISMDPAEKFPAAGLTGEEICSTDFALKMGTVKGWPSDTVYGGFRPTVPATTGSDFSALGKITNFTVVADGTDKYNITMTTADGKTYKGVVDNTRTTANTMKLVGATAEDYIVFDRPSFETISKLTAGNDGTTAATPPAEAANDTAIKLADVAPATPSVNLGLSSKKLILSGGTEGGPQGVENLTGISVGADGVIVGSHSVLGEIIIGRIDLATFANPQGLLQSGNTYFTPTPNSGTINYCQPGTDGAGKIVSGSLELSNVDLSREFADMITTQRGFQASSRLITVSDEMLNELVNLKR